MRKNINSNKYEGTDLSVAKEKRILLIEQLAQKEIEKAYPTNKQLFILRKGKHIKTKDTTDMNTYIDTIQDKIISLTTAINSATTIEDVNLIVW